MIGRAPLVIVSGAPAAGKTTLARRLASEFRLPLVVRDDVKEALMDSLGCESPDRSAELGVASFAVVFAMLSELLRSGAGAIIETNFRRGRSEAQLLPYVARSSAVLIHCDCADVMTRFMSRVRHPGHFPDAAVGRLREDLRCRRFEPLTLDVPTMRVDCSDRYEPAFEDVVSFISTAVLD